MRIAIFLDYVAGVGGKGRFVPTLLVSLEWYQISLKMPFTGITARGKSNPNKWAKDILRQLGTKNSQIPMHLADINARLME